MCPHGVYVEKDDKGSGYILIEKIALIKKCGFGF